MQHIVVALALAASVSAFAPPRLVATTPAAKSALPLSAPKPLTSLQSAVAEETLSNIRTVRAFSNEEGEIKRFDAKNGEVYRIGRKKAIYSAVY